MIVPTIVDLQRFSIGRFVVKEVAVLSKGSVLSHHIFASLLSWNLLIKSESCASWLIANHHKLQWEDGMVQQGETYYGCD